MTRKLPLEKWDEFEKICKREFGQAPSAVEATVVVEEENGEIIGFVCARWLVVVGPMWVRPDRRKGLNVFIALLDKMRLITRAKVAYTWTKDLALARLYRMIGLTSEGEALSWRDDV